MAVTQMSAALGTGIASAIKLGKDATVAGVQSGAINARTLQGGYQAFGTIKNQTAQGRSLGASALKGAASYALYMNAPQLMYGMQISKAAIGGARAAVNFRDRRGQEIALGSRQDVVGGNFMDTEQAQTMRQAAVQQIQANKLNARSALGGEARIFSGRRHNQYRRPYI